MLLIELSCNELHQLHQNQYESSTCKTNITVVKDNTWLLASNPGPALPDWYRVLRFSDMDNQRHADCKNCKRQDVGPKHFCHDRLLFHGVFGITEVN